MAKTIKIAEIISNDIRSRANINIIFSAIDGVKEHVVLDFTEVSFVSRSFADELYNLINNNKNLSIINMTPFVSSMYKTVCEGRNSKRVFSTESSEIKEFEDMKSLAVFFSSF